MATSRTHRRRIGDILIDEGLISENQLNEALELQRQTGELLGNILMDIGLVTESDIAKIVSVQYQLPFLSLKNYEFDESHLEKFDPAYLHRHRLLPFDQVGGTLLVLVTEVPSAEALGEIPARTGLNAGLFVGYTSEVTKKLETLVPLPEELRRTRTASVVPAADPDAEVAPNVLFSGDEKDLMQELDSTWDSIFESLDGGDSDGEETSPDETPAE